MRALRHIRHALSEDSAKTIASALIGSRLDYANGVLVGISSRNTIKLQRIQNSLARVVTRQNRRTSATQALSRLHWLPVKWRIDFKVATITHKLLYTGKPAYLSSRISSYVPERTLRSSNTGGLAVPRTKTVIGARAFRVAAPTIWNQLPVNLRTTTSLQIFRGKLKTFYFRLAFC